jgi:ATP-binding cassette, subfamily F, member 3
VMLLDEPSNHLDIGATRWLEDYLIKQPEAMLIVSHDRYFLNKVVTKVFEMNGKQIASYPGNYEAYWRLRRERYEQQMKTWESQKEYIEKQEEYIRRVHYGQLHKQAASRQKQIDKIERIERPVWIDSPHMHFGEVRRTGDIVLDVEHLSKAYDQPLFTDLTFMLKRGQRMGIMGPNGCGKTTLLKILLGLETPDAGTVAQGHLVEFGYYDQHLHALDGDKQVIRAAWPHDDIDANEQAMRDLLGRFGLVGDLVYQTVNKLSGGERSRAALAKLVAQGVNVLILDEPTNHLDLWACDALEQAMLEFEGTAIVVSHDRYFLNRVVDLLLVFEGNGVVKIIYGNYDTYERMRLLQEPEKKGPAKVVKEETRSTAKPAKRKRVFPYRKVSDLETDIAAEESRVKELEKTLASPDLYREGVKVQEITKAFEDAKIKLKQLYDHWEEAVELNG